LPLLERVLPAREGNGLKSKRVRVKKERRRGAAFIIVACNRFNAVDPFLSVRLWENDSFAWNFAYFCGVKEVYRKEYTSTERGRKDN